MPTATIDHTLTPAQCATFHEQGFLGVVSLFQVEQTRKNQFGSRQIHQVVVIDHDSFFNRFVSRSVRALRSMAG